MAKLTYQERKNLPSKSFVEPGERKYPIPDASHARNALARVSQHGSSSEKARVRAAVHKKFPAIGNHRNAGEGMHHMHHGQHDGDGHHSSVHHAGVHHHTVNIHLHHPGGKKKFRI